MIKLHMKILGWNGSFRENISDLLSPAEQREEQENGSFYLSVPLKEPPKYDDVVKGKQVCVQMYKHTNTHMNTKNMQSHTNKETNIHEQLYVLTQHRHTQKCWYACCTHAHNHTSRRIEGRIEDVREECSEGEQHIVPPTFLNIFIFSIIEPRICSVCMAACSSETNACVSNPLIELL